MVRAIAARSSGSSSLVRTSRVTSSSPRSREKIVDWRRSTVATAYKRSVSGNHRSSPIRGRWASDIAVSDCSITSGSWVAQTTAAPVSRARRARRIATAIAFAPSSRDVGSSASSTQRPRRDGPGDRHAGPLALREPRDPLGRALRQADRVERRESLGPRLVAAAQRERELDVLERGEVRDEPGLLADVGDLLAAQLRARRRGRAQSARCRRRSLCRRPAARARRGCAGASSCRSRTGR